MKSFIAKYFSFKGRLSRKPYIFITIALNLLLGLNYIIDENYIIFRLILIIVIILIYPILLISSTVRRLHDMNLSFWWLPWTIIATTLLENFLPKSFYIIPYIIIALIPGTKGHNKYGPDPLERERIPEQVKTI